MVLRKRFTHLPRVVRGAEAGVQRARRAAQRQVVLGLGAHHHAVPAPRRLQELRRPVAGARRQELHERAVVLRRTGRWARAVGGGGRGRGGTHDLAEQPVQHGHARGGARGGRRVRGRARLQVQLAHVGHQRRRLLRDARQLVVARHVQAELLRAQGCNAATDRLLGVSGNAPEGGFLHSFYFTFRYFFDFKTASKVNLRMFKLRNWSDDSLEWFLRLKKIILLFR